MTNIIVCILFVSMAYAIGKKCFRTAGFHTFSDAEELLFSIGLGFGIVSYAIFLMGILGILYNWLILSLAIIAMIFLFFEVKYFYLFSYKFIIKSKQNIFSVSFFYHVLLVALIGCFLLNLIGALTPPIHHDALSYNLYAPKRFLLKHGIFLVPDSTQSNTPILTEMLYLFAMGVKGDIFAKMLHYIMGIFDVLIILFFSVKFVKSYKVGILASLIFYLQPEVEAQSVIAKTDLALTFYFLLTVYAFFNWINSVKEGDNKWLILSSIFLGLTASTKLSGGYFYPLFFLAVVLIYLLNKKSSLITAFNRAFLYSFIGLLVVLPWYIKSYIFFRDPLYPLLTYGSGQYVGAEFHRNISQYFLIPWNMVFHIDKFESGSTSASIIYLAFLPCVFLLKKRDKNIMILLVVSLIWITMFFIAGGITARWILPSLALLPIVYAFSIDTFFKNVRMPVKIFVMMLLLFHFSFRMAITTKYCLNQWAPFAFGLETKDAYLSRSLSMKVYDMYKFINLNLPMNAKIFSPDETRGYYLEREFITGNSMYADINGIITCADLVKRLKELGFTHIMLNKNYQNTLIEMLKKNKIPNNPENNLFYKYEERLLKDNYCRLVFEKNNIFLYELVNRPSIN